VWICNNLGCITLVTKVMQCEMQVHFCWLIYSVTIWYKRQRWSVKVVLSTLRVLYTITKTTGQQEVSNSLCKNLKTQPHWTKVNKCTWEQKVRHTSCRYVVACYVYCLGICVLLLPCVCNSLAILNCQSRFSVLIALFDLLCFVSNIHQSISQSINQSINQSTWGRARCVILWLEPCNTLSNGISQIDAAFLATTRKTYYGLVNREVHWNHCKMHRFWNFFHNFLLNICTNNFAARSCWSEKLHRQQSLIIWKWTQVLIFCDFFLF